MLEFRNCYKIFLNVERIGVKGKTNMQGAELKQIPDSKSRFIFQWWSFILKNNSYLNFS